MTQPIDNSPAINAVTGAPPDISPTPSAPTPTPAGPAVPTTVQPTVQPTEQPTEQSTAAKTGWGHAILQAMTGGPQYVIGEDGVRREAPQTKANLGRALTATVLAGLMAPDKYRDTNFGQVRDFSGTAASAYGAAQQKMQQQRNLPQKISDEERARKLQTFDNTSKLVALQGASARMKHQQMEDSKPQIDDFLAPFKEYEEERTANNDPNQPKAFLVQTQTAAQILAGGHHLMDSNVVQDGWTEKWNDTTKQMEPEPTYAVLNPNLKEVQLSKKQLDLLNTVNSQWKDLDKFVGGNPRLRVNAYVSAMRDYEAVTTGSTVLNALYHELNPDAKNDITQAQVAAAARSGRDNNRNIMPALYSLAHAAAGGQMPDQRPDNLLDVLLKQGGPGADVLKMLGISPEEAAKRQEGIVNKRTSDQAIAKLGGVGDRAPAAQSAVESLIQAANDNLTDPQDRERFQPFLPADGRTMTQGQLARASKELQTIVQASHTNKMRDGNPDEMKKSVANVIQGDMSDIKDMMSARNNVRQTYSNMLQDEAQRLGLDRSRYTIEQQKAKAQKFSDFSSDDKNKVGSQLVGFGKMLGHFNESWEANQQWTRSGSPLLNKPISWLAKNATNDQDWKRFQSSLIAPAKEYINLLNQGRAESEIDAKELQNIITDDMTPAQAITALQTFAQTADVQVSVLGRHYLETVGNTYRVIDPTSASILDTILGKGKSQAARIAQPIPRGWQRGSDGQLQATPLNDRRLLQQIYADAGGDVSLATRIARENGWAVPDPSQPK